MINRPIPRTLMSSSGFTLVEILVAIAIFAVVMTTVFGSFQAVFSNNEKIRQSDVAIEAAKDCFDRMVIDLSEIYIPQSPYYKPPGINDPATAYRVVADTAVVENREFSRLRFTSLAHTAMGLNPADGIAEIVYYVMPAGEDRLDLRRSDTLFPYRSFEPRKTDPILCRNIGAFVVELVDHEGKTHPRWNSDGEDFEYATPRAVNILVAIGQPPEERKFETTVRLPVFREAERP